MWGKPARREGGHNAILEETYLSDFLSVIIFGCHFDTAR